MTTTTTTDCRQHPLRHVSDHSDAATQGGGWYCDDRACPSFRRRVETDAQHAERVRVERLRLGLPPDDDSFPRLVKRLRAITSRMSDLNGPTPKDAQAQLEAVLAEESLPHVPAAPVGDLELRLRLAQENERLARAVNDSLRLTLDDKDREIAALVEQLASAEQRATWAAESAGRFAHAD